VIEHGVKTPPDVSYTGEYDRGLAVVNNLTLRGRRTGADAYQEANRHLPLDLAGINSEVAGGLGDIPHYKLPYIESRYRFFFNPIRYTSLGLSVCEAMMLGMPVVAFATTEMPSVIENGRSGYINSNLGRLIDCMKELIDDRSLAHGLGQGAQRHAKERFNIERFVRDWGRVFNLVCGGARV
jgi:glycosyltransferase involved in cell wall biosynthesis